MLKRIREQTGSAGLLVAVIALVVAIGGGAYAATQSSPNHKKGGAEQKLTPRQKSEVKKLAAKYAGKDGAAGANGAPGSPGAKGSDGSNGNNGASVLIDNTAPGCGADGGVTLEVEGTPASATEVCNGEEGAAGESPEGFPFDGANEPEIGGNPHPCNENGGIEYEVGGVSNVVCNGPEGSAGPEGSPWTAGGNLPPGATETGTWAFQATTADTAGAFVPISFTLPLKYELPEEEGQVHYQGQPGFSTHCSGSSFLAKADPGHLCVYQISLVNATFANFEAPFDGARRSGATLIFTPTGVAHGYGSWAVTGCSKDVGVTPQCP